MKFNEKQIAFLKSLNLPFDFQSQLSDEEYFQLDDAVTDYLQSHGIDANDKVNSVGKLCEGILDILAAE